MIIIVMDVDDSVLRLLMENLQTLWMKDVPRENVGTVVSYLKGALLLLYCFSTIPTDAMGLLNDVIVLADYTSFTEYMKSIYFTPKRNSTVFGYMEYFDTSEAERIIMYRKCK